MALQPKFSIYESKRVENEHPLTMGNIKVELLCGNWTRIYTFTNLLTVLPQTSDILGF